MSRLVSLKPIGRLAYIMATLLAAVVILACCAVLAKINVPDLELAIHIRTVVYIIGSVTLTLHPKGENLGFPYDDYRPSHETVFKIDNLLTGISTHETVAIDS